MQAKTGCPGIWRVGVLLEASSQKPLRENPMRVIKAVADESLDSACETVAMCKQSLLSTYDYINDYTALPSSSQAGCTLRSIDQSNCKYPSTIVAPISQEKVDFEDLYSDLQMSTKELEISTGLPQRSIPNLLLASQHFMQSYGFYTREQVWYRYLTPPPLKQVVLTPCETSTHLTLTHPDEVIGQLYEQCGREPVAMTRGFDYVLRVKLPSSHETNSTEKLDHVLTFRVLEATPTLQGVVTATTEVVLLPPNEQELESDWLLRSSGSQSSRRRSTIRRESAASASDILLEVESEYSELSNSDFEDYVIDVVAMANYKLQSHCVVLPKSSASTHGVFHCQSVWVCSVARDVATMAMTFDDLTLSLSNDPPLDGPRMHSALVFVYEDEFELEQYVPPSRLGVDYEISELTRAYIHPELLFYLYPETLSYSRSYQLRVKRCRETVPTLREMKVAQVYQPGEVSPNSVDGLYNVLRKQSLFLSIGDVIGINTDTGKVFYKVTSLEPHIYNSSHIDSSNTWECNFQQPRKVYNHLPDLVPPSLIDRPDFFSDIRPPGLEEFTNELFSHFIPAFRQESSTGPRRSPSVLVTGPRGVGKRTVVKAVARRCRMNVVEVNCYEFSSETVGVSEKMVTSELDRASSNAPLVVLLGNIHMMGMRDHIHQEPRLLAMFEVYMQHIDLFNRTNRFPILVVGLTSHPGSIPARVQACFLHQLDVTTPTQEKRLSMLESLGRDYHLAASVDLVDLSRRTAGFCLGDLLALYSSAYTLAYQSVVEYCGKENVISHTADLAVVGVVLTETHLDTALNTLHSSHADSIGAPKIPNVQWEDVGGLGDAKKEILDTIQLPLLHPELFSATVQRSGVLLYGPPGTGKTLLAKAVATECSLNFLSVKGPELINMYVGQSEENIREVFSRASSAAPSVIFFDELDSIAPNRGRSGDSGGVMDRVVSQLLAELDGLNKSEHVFVIGASNRPDLIDPALLRPGRFDRLVYLGISEDVESKLKILQAVTRQFQLSPEVNLEEVATRCPSNLTGADLYSLCSDAMLTAFRRQIDELEKHNKSDDEWTGELLVTQEDFLTSLAGLTPSVPPEELLRYQTLRTTLRN